MNEAVQDRIISDWIDTLADYTIDEIKSAINTVLSQNPEQATNEQFVKNAIQKARGARLLAAKHAMQVGT